MMQPPVQEPRESILIYCPSCKNEFRGMVGRRERQNDMRCALCPAWLNTPWQTKLPTKKKPPTAHGVLEQVSQVWRAVHVHGVRRPVVPPVQGVLHGSHGRCARTRSSHCLYQKACLMP